MTFSTPFLSPMGTITFSNPPWVMQVSLALFWDKQDDNLDPKQQAFLVVVGSGGRGSVLLHPLHPLPLQPPPPPSTLLSRAGGHSSLVRWWEVTWGPCSAPTAPWSSAPLREGPWLHKFSPLRLGHQLREGASVAIRRLETAEKESYPGSGGSA